MLKCKSVQFEKQPSNSSLLLSLHNMNLICTMLYTGLWNQENCMELPKPHFLLQKNSEMHFERFLLWERDLCFVNSQTGYELFN